MLNIKTLAMKTIKNSLLTLAIFFFGVTSFAAESDSLGEIGDGLDLYAVLDAFKSSTSVEGFEKTINDQSQKINNLDLDEDGNVDYIKVIDNVESDAHAIILRIDLSETESQDIAVIELEKTADNTANIQIAGDEEIYGENYLVEPVAESSTETERLLKPSAVIIVNVWHWPSVRFIYGPTYKPWVSPYRWHHYPAYWKPWRPYKWHTYHNFHKAHHRHYKVAHVHHGTKAHGIYKKHRRTSVRVRNHHKHHANKGHHANGHKGNGNHKNNNHKSSGNHKGNGHKKGGKGHGGGHHK